MRSAGKQHLKGPSKHSLSAGRSPDTTARVWPTYQLVVQWFFFGACLEEELVRQNTVLCAVKIANRVQPASLPVVIESILQTCVGRRHIKTVITAVITAVITVKSVTASAWSGFETSRRFNILFRLVLIDLFVFLTGNH